MKIFTIRLEGEKKNKKPISMTEGSGEVHGNPSQFVMPQSSYDSQKNIYNSGDDFKPDIIIDKEP